MRLNLKFKKEKLANVKIEQRSPVDS